MSSPVGAMFGRIAKVYDLLNHLLSLGIDIRWRKELAVLAQGSRILDLAAGTLDVALALSQTHPGAEIMAMDFCEPMLKIGGSKLQKAGLQKQIGLCAADAFHIPLPPSSVDSVTMAFGIRNISPRDEAFREMKRVLKPRGRMCILEFGSASEAIWGGMYNIYLGLLLPLIGRVVARDKSAYSYLARTIRDFPTPPVLAGEMQDAGFQNIQYRRLTGGIVCLHWGDKPG